MTRFLPCTEARKPVPWISIVLVKPSDTPRTMEATSARVVPHIMRDCVSLRRGATETWLSSTFASRVSLTGMLSVPSLPLADRMPFAIATVTPAGRATGYLPTRDIAPFPSEHPEQHFAAHIGRARLTVRQHAARRGQDRGAQAGIDAGQFLDAGIDPATGLAHA